jgi:Flp pilus assembly protein TadB
MSAQRSPRDRAAAQPDLAYRRPQITHLRARRRAARRRRRLARIDLGLGMAGAIVLLLATPGLAITLLVTIAILAACTFSIVRERRRARAQSAPPRRSPRPRAGEQARPQPRGSERARAGSAGRR